MSEQTGVRFTLLTMFVVTGFVAVAMAVLFAFPDVWATVALIALLQIVPAVLTVGLVWGNSNLRAFCLGALFPTVLTLLFCASVWVLFVLVESSHEPAARIAGGLEHYADGHRIVAAVSWLCALLMGVITLSVRHAIARSEKS